MKWFATNKIGVLLAALPLAFLVIVAADTLRSAVLDFYPDDYWMRIVSVEVPDHVEGQNPDLMYNRQVTAEFIFIARADVEVLDPAGRLVEGCQTSREYTYKPGSGPVPMSLQFYIGAGPGKCKIPPGCYVMETNWWPKVGDWIRSRPIHNETEEFCVKPRTD